MSIKTKSNKKAARDLIAATFEAWVDSADFIFGNKDLVAVRDRAVVRRGDVYYVERDGYAPVVFRCFYSALVFARHGDYDSKIKQYFKMHDQRLDIHYRSAIDSKQLHTAALKKNNIWRAELYMHKYNEAVHSIAVTKRLMQDYKINI